MKVTITPPGAEHPALFRRLTYVLGLSSVGDWLALFALTAYVAEISDRAEFAVGSLLLFRVIPGIILGPIAGLLVDRFDRRWVIAASDIARAALVLVIPFTRTIWVIFAINALLEVFSLLGKPAVMATVPRLVGRGNLIRANQTLSIALYAMLPVGGALLSLLTIPAAWLARVEGVAWVAGDPIRLPMIINAATFIVSAIVIARFPAGIMRGGAAGIEDAHVRRDLVQGFRYAWQERPIRLTLGGAWLAFIGGSAAAALGPVYASQIVTGGAAEAQALWGSLIVAVGLGLVTGMLATGKVERLVRRVPVFPLGLIVAGGATTMIGIWMSAPTAIAGAAISGSGVGIAWVAALAMLQQSVSDDMRGRVFATLFTGSQVALFIGLAGWPLLAGTIEAIIGPTYPIGARIALVGGGAVLVLGGFIALLAPTFTNEGTAEGR